MLEQNIGLDSKSRSECFGTNAILWAASELNFAWALAHLGRFDEAIGHGDAGPRIAEENDHPWTLFIGLYLLGAAQSVRGDFARAARLLERSLHLGRTWQFVERTPHVAAALGGVYALTGRTEEGLALVADAAKEYRAGRGQGHHHTFPLGAGRAYLAAGRIDEATDYAREVLALTRQLGMRGIESQALSLTAAIAAASGA